MHKITVELVWPHAKNGQKKATSKNFGMVSTWKKKKWKTLKFVDAGMREKGINNMKWHIIGWELTVEIYNVIFSL